MRDMTRSLARYCLGDPVKYDEIIGICSTCRWKTELHSNFRRETQRKRPLALERGEGCATGTHTFTAIYPFQAIPSNLFHIRFNIIISSIATSLPSCSKLQVSPPTSHTPCVRDTSHATHPYSISLLQ
jgi:hypothetical protein